jgi:hypothetical protein
MQSRKKQQTELVRSVLYAEADKKRKERENLQATDWSFWLHRELLPFSLLRLHIIIIFLQTI